MSKYFNIAGPCNPQDHYMLNAADRLREVMPLIEQKQYFVIHAARQSGKTTFLWDLEQRLNDSGKYYALYCSLEGLQGVTDPKEGIPAIVNCIKLALQMQAVIPDRETFAQSADFSDFTNVLLAELCKFCSRLDRPLVILFDEADCLSANTLISFLRQLRNGYNSRIRTPFVHTVALVGMRNIRDFKAQVRPDSETLGSASPFNIVTKSLTLTNFTQEEIVTLYAQHTNDTGQIFEPQALELVYRQTQGQPWLVNAIAREVVVETLQSDYTQPVTAPMVSEAIQTIIRRRDTHIDSLLERLKEERVRRIIEPVIIGEQASIEMLSDDYRYTEDLGLVRYTPSVGVAPANPIYAEVIVRTLNWSSQSEIESTHPEYHMPRYFKDGKIDVGYLLRDFQDFWRENSEIWEERFQYKEAAPHLILMAFLQRVINGGGHLIREMAAGKKRLDLCIDYKANKYPLELKVYRKESTYDEGIVQLARYMDTLGSAEGWLLVFDRRPDRTWGEKIFTRTETTPDGKMITIVGC
ncbi:hypothetical protein FACS1894156_4010 [Bacteroidia bacterium]|nr:hypothetical protein FACS1894156_4010 [Bacteroidia bacterium]